MGHYLGATGRPTSVDMSHCKGWNPLSTDPLTGESGELIHRLLAVIGESGSSGSSGILTCQMLLAIAVGGEPANVFIDRPTVPGTVGAEMRESAARVVSDEEWLDLVSRRLSHLVNQGVDEGFLVRALRDMLTVEQERLSDFGEGFDKRKEMRDRLRHDAEDPSAIEEFRQKLITNNPGATAFNADQVADRMREMADRILREPDADEATARWSEMAAWNARVARHLSDQVIEVWRREFFMHRRND